MEQSEEYDNNEDNEKEILDIIILVNHILSPAAVELEGADINNDGNPDEPYVMDEVMYIGRVQMNLNDGRKRKFLYFQTDYELKQ